MLLYSGIKLIFLLMIKLQNFKYIGAGGCFINCREINSERKLNCSRIFILILLAIALPFSISAQKANEANFKGEWQLIELVNIEMIRPYAMKMTVVQNDARIDARINVKYLITSTDNSKREYEYTYFTDGRGETNSDLFDLGTPKTHTNIDKNSLNTVGLESLKTKNTRGGDIYNDYKYTQEWKLSKDANTLTITLKIIRLNMPGRGALLRQRIFKRIK